MLKGYTGKLLFVNLSTGDIREEEPDDSLYRDYIGGYGLGARILYDRMEAGVDPLGPDNMLGIVTGPLTGTPTPTGARYVAVAKSPLTGGWGDANSGGKFGPALKFAGYDAVFFTGISPKPVYLVVDNGKAELKDASDLWGKEAYDTEDILKEQYGKKSEAIFIGPFGEKVSLIACILTERGAAAGRSGMGAVMGSKKLKAIVAIGDEKSLELADKDRMNAARKKHIDAIRTPGPGGVSFVDTFHTYGTTSITSNSAHSGDTPIKNWGGIGVVDMPDVSEITPDASISNLDKRFGCWHCPIACQASLKEGTGEYTYPAGNRRPEYETQGTFGGMCLNNNRESIEMCSHICNTYGIDTISGGCAISFAIECYENGILTKKDTDGIELTWGNHKAIVEMTWKLAKREGLGDILADGVKKAAERIGKGSEKYAVHMGGQEIGMHDPKLMKPGDTGAARYHIDPTPGRHTQAAGPGSFGTHVVNATGMCLFGGMGPFLLQYMQAVTGHPYTQEELDQCGERILTVRHCFNLREGINPLQWTVHPRIVGDPPLQEGPLAGVRADIEAQDYWCLGGLDWDRVTTKPSKAKLMKLGLNEIADELHPPQANPFGPPPA